MDFFAVVLLLAIAAWILTRQLRKRQQYRYLVEQGLRTDARIIQRFERRLPKARRRQFVEYVFDTAEGISVSQKVPVTRAEYESAGSGRAIPIIYDPREPSINRPTAYLARKGYLNES